MLKASDICPVISAECERWLKSIGYYEKPASLKYHGAETGGLFRHSLALVSFLQYMTDRLGLTWEREESPAVVGLFHDVCKCDDYVLEAGVWVSNKNKKDGHGEKSILMLKDHIKLTQEETACIQYHMGAFTNKEEWQYYTQAVQTYSNVLFTHTADMVASQILGA